MRLVARLLRLPNLKCVASLRELEPLQTALSGAEADGNVDGSSGGTNASSLSWCGALVRVRSLRIGMSWDSRTRVYIYCCRHHQVSA